MTNKPAYVDEEPFICPECGSHRSNGQTNLDPGWTFGSGEPRSPWDAVLETFDCADCFNTIPGHLAQRWEGRTVKEAQHEWANVFRPLRDEDEVRLINLLAAGWEVVGEGNESIQLLDADYDVCVSIAELIEDIDYQSDEGVDWSFLASLDGLREGFEPPASPLTELEELLSLIDGVTLEEHEWGRGARSGVYKYLLVQKVKSYQVMRVLEAVASQLRQQARMPPTSC